MSDILQRKDWEVRQFTQLQSLAEDIRQLKSGQLLESSGSFVPALTAATAWSTPPTYASSGADQEADWYRIGNLVKCRIFWALSNSAALPVSSSGADALTITGYPFVAAPGLGSSNLIYDFGVTSGQNWTIPPNKDPLPAASMYEGTQIMDLYWIDDTTGATQTVQVQDLLQGSSFFQVFTYLVIP